MVAQNSNKKTVVLWELLSIHESHRRTIAFLISHSFHSDTDIFGKFQGCQYPINIAETIINNQFMWSYLLQINFSHDLALNKPY